MKAAIVALVLLGGIFVGYSAHASVTVDGQTVSCDAAGYANVDESSPTEPDSSTPPPDCEGLPV